MGGFSGCVSIMGIHFSNYNWMLTPPPGYLAGGDNVGDACRPKRLPSPKMHDFRS